MAGFCPQAPPLQKNPTSKDLEEKSDKAFYVFQKELSRQNKILSSMIWLNFTKKICARDPLEMRKFQN